VTDFEDRQVVFSHRSVWEAFVAWMASTGLETFPIPVDDDLPTYGIGVSVRKEQT
jgi:hypothetical protein